ncbi:MAG: Tetratricopeptide 2 repeat protein [Deltaproteobacteria bacterium]|nr:Tetratricopeptide 2 repeat protein [Deltaproteobacteria bacterium]
MAAQEPTKPHEPPKPVQIGGETLVERLLPHIKKIVVGVILLAVVASIVFGIRYFNQRKDAQDTDKLAAVLEVGHRPIATPGATPDPKNPEFADQKARAQTVLDEMAKQDTNKAGPAVRGALLVDAGKLDEAIAEYKKCLPGPNIEDILCREGLGIALETKAGTEKDPAARQQGLEGALTAFLAMQPAEDGARRAYALYHQARIQLQLGKTAEAKALFQKAKELTPPKELAVLIDRRLANLGAS